MNSKGELDLQEGNELILPCPVTLKSGGGGSGFRAEINRSCRHLVLARGLATRPRADTFARPPLATP